jgi:hypothetical protein
MAETSDLLSRASASAFAGLPAHTKHETFFRIKPQFDLPSLTIQRLCHTRVRIFEHLLDLVRYQLLIIYVFSVRTYTIALHCSAKGRNSVVIASAILEYGVKPNADGDGTGKNCQSIGQE